MNRRGATGMQEDVRVDLRNPVERGSEDDPQRARDEHARRQRTKRAQLSPDGASVRRGESERDHGHLGRDEYEVANDSRPVVAREKLAQGLEQKHPGDDGAPEELAATRTEGRSRRRPRFRSTPEDGRPCDRCTAHGGKRAHRRSLHRGPLRRPAGRRESAAARPIVGTTRPLFYVRVHPCETKKGRLQSVEQPDSCAWGPPSSDECEVGCSRV